MEAKQIYTPTLPNLVSYIQYIVNNYFTAHEFTQLHQIFNISVTSYTLKKTGRLALITTCYH